MASLAAFPVRWARDNEPFRQPQRSARRDGWTLDPSPHALRGAAAGLLAAEVFGSLLMWGPIPLAWMWIGSQVYAATTSMMADGVVVLAGFLATTVLTMKCLIRLDEAWIRLRVGAGIDQREGALTRVVIASAALGLLAFFVWYYLLSNAFIIPFMPMR
jgi:hypothetical protein